MDKETLSQETELEKATRNLCELLIQTKKAELEYEMQLQQTKKENEMKVKKRLGDLTLQEAARFCETHRLECWKCPLEEDCEACGCKSWLYFIYRIKYIEIEV